ncbi:SDR family NAD(P)-dependent oxidoreductase [Natrononativus amylolyticus]|uniref:SDR family NAD(P)-dependent oxidoreductase n=1 Tax=Natrononativus amylolyticus TaxID=2963434 RepID=UPI0020CE2117|nr:SDR family oxidoreductase [Natrononativus amylolyticus]
MSNIGIDADLDGQVAVVIGGTTGIGRAISEALSAAGADVVPTSRTKSSVEDAADAVDCNLVCPTDVTDRDAVRSLFESTVENIGEINILVNSAGVVQEAKPVEEITDDEWGLIFDTNVYGVFLASQLIPDYMANAPRIILNVSSMNGERAVRELSAYNSSKYGVKGLTETLALEFAERGIRVNAIAPGYVKTRQNEEVLDNEEVSAAIHKRTPLSRYAELDEIAGSALFLCSPAAEFITGETLVIDGGFSVK